ncbi:serine/threonine-protein kinase [Actinomycetospora aeridis]|uniref:non-specific serine/threonine protein kinase n=1 Tax=Actinomycetospora aeridis TaxID=3129231 RepID=A0ABU8NAR2_9PSEU
MPRLPGYADFVPIGSGGFATVHRARRIAFDQVVAVKFVHLSGAPDGVRMRFDRERRALGSLAHHPHIVTVYDGGFAPEGEPYLVMEYLPAGSLDRWAGHLDVAEVLRIGVQMAGALETAHRAGVLHRDVKPANILRSRFGDPVLADFGIARLAGGSRTTSGMVTASLPYAPPEVLEARAPSPASDVWSLAAALVCLLSGRPPFVDEVGDGGAAALIARIVRREPPDLAAMGIPDELVPTLQAALTDDDRRRSTGAAAFARSLRDVQRMRGEALTVPVVEEFADGEPSSPTRHGPDSDRSATVPVDVARAETEGPAPRPTADDPTPRRAWRGPAVVVGALVLAVAVAAAVLAGVTGTGRSSAAGAAPAVAPVAVPPSTTVVSPPPEFPDDYAGTWSGLVADLTDDADPGNTVTIVMVAGTSTGRIRTRLTSGEQCSGRVELRAVSPEGTLITLEEIIEVGADFCSGRTFTLTTAGFGDVLRYQYEVPGRPDAPLIGVLENQGPPT